MSGDVQQFLSIGLIDLEAMRVRDLLENVGEEDQTENNMSKLL